MPVIKVVTSTGARKTKAQLESGQVGICRNGKTICQGRCYRAVRTHGWAENLPRRSSTSKSDKCLPGIRGGSQILEYQTFTGLGKIATTNIGYRSCTHSAFHPEGDIT